MPEYRNLSDTDLIHRACSNHDVQAFENIFKRYKHLAYGVSLKYLNSQTAAREAVNPIFLKLWEDCHHYQINNFKTWFYKVIKNHCFIELRKTSSNQEVLSKLIVENVEWEENLYLKLHNEQMLVFLNQCLKALKAEQLKCIENFYLQGKSYQQTADITGFTYDEVKNYLQNGRRNLKICLHQKSSLK